MGASHKHPIISKTLETVDLRKNLDKINEVFIREAYKNIYFYDEISGKNLVLPAVYFEPIDNLENDFWNTAYNRVRLFWHNTVKSFSQAHKCSIVE